MVDSTFDPNSFMQASFTESNSTTFTPVPEGEYTAAIMNPDDLKMRTIDNGSLILDVKWTIDDPQVKEVTGLDTNSVRQSIFLDVTADGGLDFSKGKNIQLGRLREALDQNQAGQPWSFSNLIGSVARVIVTHRLGNDQIFSAIKTVTKL